ncbi:hypothetical protein Lpp125_15035, partial [Lacticaseibacillus paracasei subsp. paracasei Lpp125]
MDNMNIWLTTCTSDNALDFWGKAGEVPYTFKKCLKVTDRFRSPAFARDNHKDSGRIGQRAVDCDTARGLLQRDGVNLTANKITIGGLRGSWQWG